MLQQLYELNYMWIRFEYFVREKAPEAHRGGDCYQLMQGYGSQEARRLVKALAFSGRGNQEPSQVCEIFSLGYF